MLVKSYLENEVDKMFKQNEYYQLRFGIENIELLIFHSLSLIYVY